MQKDRGIKEDNSRSLAQAAGKQCHWPPERTGLGQCQEILGWARGPWVIPQDTAGENECGAWGRGQAGVSKAGSHSQLGGRKSVKGRESLVHPSL